MQVGANTIGQTEVDDSHRGRVLGLMDDDHGRWRDRRHVARRRPGQIVGIVQMTVIQGTGYLLAGLIVLGVARRAHKLSSTPAHVAEAQPELPFSAAITADAATLNPEAALASDR